MEQKHLFFTDKVKMGKKGQITIPKRMRDEDKLKEDDIFIVMHMPGGDIVMSKQKVKAPEDIMLEAIQKAPKFNAEEAWREILEERKQERA